jgi:hypothetical protein
MFDYRVALEFDCCDCGQPVGLTVQCSRKGPVQDGEATTARVRVPCPTCGGINEVFFEPDGTVRCVRPHAGFRSPAPSVN